MARKQTTEVDLSEFAAHEKTGGNPGKWPEIVRHLGPDLTETLIAALEDPRISGGQILRWLETKGYTNVTQSGVDNWKRNRRRG